MRSASNPFNPGIIHNLVMALTGLLLFGAATIGQAQFTYTTNLDGTLTLTSYTGSGGNLTFPTNINGMTVSGLGENVLLFNTNVTSINIPGSITNLAPWTIYMSQGITNAILGYGITSIPTNMFVSCVNLANVTIPDSVTCIGPWAFFGSKLTEVTIPPGVTSIASVFDDCPSLITAYLPSGITNMDGAFSGCSSLTNVIIPPKINEINPYTFAQCTSLSNILLPTNVVSINADAFYGCTALGSITIPASVTNIADGSGNFYNDGAFWGCNLLTNVTILGSPNIGAYAFYELPLTSVSIAGGVIGPFSFAFCQNLTTLNLGNGVTNIGQSAFSGDPISDLYIPSSVSNVVDNVFAGCALTNVVFGSGVALIVDYAFSEDYQLTQALFLGNSPTVIALDDKPPFAYCPVTVYYLPGTTGWSNTFGKTIYFNYGAPTALWNPIIQTGDGHFGVTNGVFGFNITNGSTTNLPISVLACTNLAKPVWTSLTNVMLTNTYYFTDPNWTNYPNRFYGIGFP